MPTSNTVDYRFSTVAYLMTKVETLTAALNADLAAKVVAPAPVFVTELGVPTSLEVPCLAVSYVGDLPPRRSAFDEKLVGCVFKVCCMIPAAGDNSHAAFEVAKIRAADFVTTLFDADAASLTFKIDGGVIGTVQAFQGERGGITSLDGMVMEDKITVMRGWQLTFSAWFALKTR